MQIIFDIMLRFPPRYCRKDAMLMHPYYNMVWDTLILHHIFQGHLKSSINDPFDILDLHQMVWRYFKS